VDSKILTSVDLVVWAVVTLAFVSAGVFFMRTPVEKHLAWDTRSGQWIYRLRLRETGDHKKALAAAATFYWWFGFAFIAMGTLHFVVVTSVLLVRMMSSGL
jgi:hypothetical protein